MRDRKSFKNCDSARLIFSEKNFAIPANMHPANMHPANMHPANMHPANMHPANIHPGMEWQREQPAQQKPLQRLFSVDRPY